jgi:hypothetical protein
MGTDILAEIRAAGITLSVDGGSLIATPKAAITDELRSLIRTHKADIMAALRRPVQKKPPRGLGGYAPPGVTPVAPLRDCAMTRQIRGMPEDNLPAVSPEIAARLSAEDLADAAAGDIAPETLQAFEAAAIAEEAEDLREAFEERAGILEFDAGLPKPQAELKAARITSTLARNRGYSWGALRSAFAGCPALLAQVPDGPGPVDSLPFDTARVHVGKDGRVLKQGTFTGPHHVTTKEETPC